MYEEETCLLAIVLQLLSLYYGIKKVVISEQFVKGKVLSHLTFRPSTVTGEDSVFHLFIQLMDVYTFSVSGL